MAPKCKPLVVFDCDDTIVVSAGQYIPALIKWGRELGLPEVSEADWKRHWGMPYDKILQLLYPELTKDLFDYVLEELGRRSNEMVVPTFPGCLEALKALKDRFHLGVLTSRHQSPRDTLVSCGFPEDFFAFVFSAVDTRGAHKPNSLAGEPVFSWMGKKAVFEWAYYVGDALSDLEFCRAIQVPFIAVTTGLVEGEEFEKVGQSPKFIFPSITEAADWLKNGGNGIVEECQECSGQL
ncbi:MAG: HAD hydrolase-like protein [Patescibacteria group bacterium]